MKAGRAHIQQLVPHAGTMCLLDEVTSWDAEQIICRGATPDEGHPLARGGSVPSIVAAEYAAQATAVHGGLLEPGSGPRAGMLASLVDVQLHVRCFDAGAGAPAVTAQLLSRSAQGCMYSFAVTQAGGTVARGRLTVAFPAGAQA